jgi:hypothetical protein
VQPEPGSVSYNSVGVQRYADYATGVAGTVTLLANPHWAGVRQALAAGTSLMQVLSAFSAAYTWASGTNFPMGANIWAAEAVRDVGGPYADPASAARRAASEDAAVDAAAASSMAVITQANQTAAAAHTDWSTQRAKSLDAAAQTAAHAAAAATARAEVQARTAAVRAIMVADYEGTSAMPSALALLTAPTPQTLLSVTEMQHYLNGIGASTVTDFDRWQNQLISEAQQAHTQAAIAAAANGAMTTDQNAWQAADARAAAAITTMTATLRAPQTDSIMSAEVDRLLASVPTALG